MHTDFWHERWSTNQIAFHESEANPLLVAHFAALGLAKGARVFVPLCGKTLDIDWLLAQGYHVVGAELSPLAVTQLFERLGVTPQLTRVGKLERWSVPHLDLFVGDFFALTPDLLGTVDAVYDRAALIALPSDLRGRYAAHCAR
jgi:thiopurine S-methyltransferase